MGIYDKLTGKDTVGLGIIVFVVIGMCSLVIWASFEIQHISNVMETYCDDIDSPISMDGEGYYFYCGKISADGSIIELKMVDFEFAEEKLEREGKLK